MEQERKTNVSGNLDVYAELPTVRANVLNPVPEYFGGVDSGKSQQLLRARRRGDVNFRQVFSDHVDSDEQQSATLELGGDDIAKL